MNAPQQKIPTELTSDVHERYNKYCTIRNTL